MRYHETDLKTAERAAYQRGDTELAALLARCDDLQQAVGAAHQALCDLHTDAEDGEKRGRILDRMAEIRDALFEVTS